MSKSFADLYEIVQCIYQSTATRVYIVRPIGSQRRFIAKEMLEQAKATEFFLETNLLQELDHPAIPQIYDIFAEEFIYVMDYFEGVTLDQYLLNNEHMEVETAISFAISLCEILSYLHERKDPILYLDLKPRNLIVAEGGLRLVDFGSAMHLSFANQNKKIFGTRGFAAPEQLEGRAIGIYTDVYGTAKILSYMSEFIKKTDAVCLRYLIKKGTNKTCKKRFSSIDEMRKILLRMQFRRRKRSKKCLLNSIAVIGSDEGVGCTHIAMALVTYLNQAGFCAAYRNMTKQQVLEQIKKNKKLPEMRDDFIYHENWVGVRDTTTNLYKSTSNRIQVYDCGTRRDLIEADATIYVCGGRLWQNHTVASWEIADRHAFIGNFFTKNMLEEFAREVCEGVYAYPYQKNVFTISREIEHLFKKLLKSFN